MPPGEREWLSARPRPRVRRRLRPSRGDRSPPPLSEPDEESRRALWSVGEGERDSDAANGDRDRLVKRPRPRALPRERSCPRVDRSPRPPPSLSGLDAELRHCSSRMARSDSASAAALFHSLGDAKGEVDVDANGGWISSAHRGEPMGGDPMGGDPVGGEPVGERDKVFVPSTEESCDAFRRSTAVSFAAVRSAGLAALRTASFSAAAATHLSGSDREDGDSQRSAAVGAGEEPTACACDTGGVRG